LPAPVPAAEPPRKRLGELLVEAGLATPGQVATALLQQASTGKRLGELLVELGSIDERQLATEMGVQLGFPCVDLRAIEPDPQAISSLSEEEARRFGALPLTRDEHHTVVAFVDPTDVNAIRGVEAILGIPVSPAIAPRSELLAAIETTYRALDRVGRHVETFQAASRPGDAPTSKRMSTEIGADAPVVQVVNLVITQAVRDRASDVHLEPKEDLVRVRYRIDGALKDVLKLPVGMAPAVASRIKVMAGLNIVERNRPQDGQIQMTVDGRQLDVRVSTVPTLHGEKVVLRLLDTTRSLVGLEELGMSDALVVGFRELIRSPFGMLLCAGPTGSGKTTTLYASLAEIADDTRNVTTIEDPVEYVFARATQIPIREQTGVSFANGLRSILRQDPDVVLVGEIRDVDTARIATQAALTGHLVLSSLHATDAAAAVHRFIDMGIEPFLVASAMLAVVGQRLVRRICEECKVRYAPSAEELVYYVEAGGKKKTKFWKGEGCPTCAGTGYRGRTGVYEVLRVDGAIGQLIVNRASHDEIRQAAVADGMTTMRDQALDLISRDVTTISEVLRAIYVL
jgi:type IV pilus assembly protein PilB